MQELHWPLTILCRAVQYKNISSAALNIGLSQPQISRLIKKIEEELGLIIIDRSSPRHAKWTPQAHQLANVYERSTKSLEHSLQEISTKQKPKTIKMATLEGLSNHASFVAHGLLKDYGLNQVTLDVYDQNDMEARFISGDLDLILSSRVPADKKTLPSKTIGHQKLEKFKSSGRYVVLSPFENIQVKRKVEKSLISNSLALRKYWLSEYGGEGVIPGPIKKYKSDDEDLPVMLIGAEQLYQGIIDYLFTELYP